MAKGLGFQGNSMWKRTVFSTSVVEQLDSHRRKIILELYHVSYTKINFKTITFLKKT